MCILNDLDRQGQKAEVDYTRGSPSPGGIPYLGDVAEGEYLSPEKEGTNTKISSGDAISHGRY